MDWPGQTLRLLPVSPDNAAMMPYIVHWQWWLRGCQHSVQSLWHCQYQPV